MRQSFSLKKKKKKKKKSASIVLQAIQYCKDGDRNFPEKDVLFAMKLHRVL